MPYYVFSLKASPSGLVGGSAVQDVLGIFFMHYPVLIGKPLCDGLC